MDQEPSAHQSFLLRTVSGAIEWGNRWLVLSRWIFGSHDNIFPRVEALILFLTVFCISLPFWIDRIHLSAALIIAFFLVQRIVEFLVVYSRNFILRRGRVFTYFQDGDARGQWLLSMFSLNVLQIMFIFATWYRLISLTDTSSFSHTLSALDSIYFSVITFCTLGYGDIIPLHAFPKILVIFQSLLTFYILVVVINGVVTAHFRR